MGNEGIIAEHPTLKLKYSDPDMAKAAAELKEKLELERVEYRQRIEHDHERERNAEMQDGESSVVQNAHNHEGHIDRKVRS
jgi:hypothetical protein